MKKQGLRIHSQRTNPTAKNRASHWRVGSLHKENGEQLNTHQKENSRRTAEIVRPEQLTRLQIDSTET